MCKDSEVEESLLYWKNWEKTCVAREEWMRGSVAPCAWRTHCLHAGEIQRLGGRGGHINYYFLIMYLDSLGESATAEEMQTLDCAAVECAILWVHFPCRRVRHVCFPAPPSGQAGSGAPSGATAAPGAALLDRTVPASFLLHLPSMFCVPGRWALVDFPLCSVVTHSIASLWFLLISSILNMSNCLTRLFCYLGVLGTDVPLNWTGPPSPSLVSLIDFGLFAPRQWVFFFVSCESLLCSSCIVCSRGDCVFCLSTLVLMSFLSFKLPTARPVACTYTWERLGLLFHEGELSFKDPDESNLPCHLPKWLTEDFLIPIHKKESPSKYPAWGKAVFPHVT